MSLVDFPSPTHVGELRTLSFTGRLILVPAQAPRSNGILNGGNAAKMNHFTVVELPYREEPHKILTTQPEYLIGVAVNSSLVSNVETHTAELLMQVPL